ncbi:RDD family protein [Cellulomonas sp. P22]|uniref:RDD family protein n=1 Tax=Cellulomonas sp. P22 TaxID=3373189 RepID=UPI0037BAEBAD
MTTAPPRFVVPAPSAPLGRRATAFVVDQLLVWLVAGVPLVLSLAPTLDALRAGRTPTAATTHPAVLVGATSLGVVLVLVQWWTHGTHGWTIGRRLLSVRTLDVRTGDPLGLWRVLVRGLVVAAGVLVCGVGQVAVLASPLFDATGRRHGWHDKATGSEVVDLRGVGRATTRRPPPRGAGGRASVGAPQRTGQVHVVPVSAAGPAAEALTPGPVDDWTLLGAGAGAGAGAGVGGGTQDPARQDAHAAASRRLDALLSERRGPTTGSLVLPPLHAPGVAPDVDTRLMPVVRPVHFVGDEPAAAPTAGLDPGLDPELEATRRAPLRADEHAPVTAPADEDQHGAELELHDGRLVRVHGSALVGRNPVAVDGIQVIRVVDPGRSVSKTHLQIGVEGDVVWVADRGSTNGTLVTLTDGAQIVCGPEQRVRLPIGATVSFGDCGLRLVRGPRKAART